MSVFVEIHAIHSVPPSNLNRDDNGSPKTAFFGGAKRHRVSSQSWKRAVRQHFAEHNEGVNLGFRTRNVAEMVANAVLAKSPEMAKEDALKAMVSILEELKILSKKKDEELKTEALFLISERQVEALADIITTIDDPKLRVKEAKKSLLVQNSLDLALFGRMVASSTDLNVDAASQFAHAISTHEVASEFDFFTAVDDATSEDHAGAGMMGDVEFNSSTLYRYAVVNATALAAQFGDSGELVTEGIARFIESFVRAIPSGKQNTFAARTLPEAVMVVVREDQPTSLVNAFEKPVSASDEGYALSSVKRLVEATQRVAEAYEVEGTVARYGTIASSEMAELSEVSELGTLKETINRAMAYVNEKEGR